jgi:hypothetical protein
VNKKQQKNFVSLGRAGFAATGPGSKKFLRRFFQKAATFFVQNAENCLLKKPLSQSMH